MTIINLKVFSSPGIRNIVVALVGAVPSPGLEVVPGVHLACVGVLQQAVRHGNGLDEQLLQLQLQDGVVHLVHEEDGANALCNSLPQHSLGLHNDAGHVVNHHEGVNCYTEGGGDLAREVWPAGSVNQVDQEADLKLTGLGVLYIGVADELEL